MGRTFSDHEAKRERVPMLVGLTGASGSGKTMSALRLATGMQRVTGGQIFYIDTEARRALHYADDFKFQHVEMSTPFSPMDYLECLKYCTNKKASIIVVDSMSHEHEGPGGVLEMHETELDRMCGSDFKKRDRMTFTAWAKPKAQRRRLINEVLRMGVNAIFCFRAKEKLKIVAGKNPIHLGWQPIAGEEFVFEMTINCLLYPNCGGVPNWAPDERGEAIMLKRPGHLKSLFQDGEPLSEETGEGLAVWAQGGLGKSPEVNRVTEALGWLEMASTTEDLKSALAQIKEQVAPSLNKIDLAVLRDAATRRSSSLRSSSKALGGQSDKKAGTGDPAAPERDPQTGEIIPDSVGK
mgnify:CR=1 FL=1